MGVDIDKLPGENQGSLETRRLKQGTFRGKGSVITVKTDFDR
jgi:hypothetical protein